MVLQSRLPLFWRFQIAGWAAFVIVTLPLKYELMGSVPAALLLCLTRDGSSFMLTLALRDLYRAFWSDDSGRMAVVVIAACTGAGILQGGLFLLLRETLPLEGEIFRYRSLALSAFYERIGLLYAWSFLYFGIKIWLEVKSKERRLQEEREMREQVELQMLRSLTNSHFLCNALSTIQETLDKGKEGAGEMVQAMSDYLQRYRPDLSRQFWGCVS